MTLETQDDAPTCPFCDRNTTWIDGRGWRCVPCGEPWAPDYPSQPDEHEGDL